MRRSGVICGGGWGIVSGWSVGWLCEVHVFRVGFVRVLRGVLVLVIEGEGAVLRRKHPEMREGLLCATRHSPFFNPCSARSHGEGGSL